MANIIQKLLITIKYEFGESLYNEEKIISVGLQDRADKLKKIYYIGDKAGNKEFKRKLIRKDQYEEMLNKASSIKVL